MQDLNDKIQGSKLTANEWNEVPSEIQHVIESVGQSLTTSDLEQLGKAIASYVSNGSFYFDNGTVDSYVLDVINDKNSPPSYVDGMVVTFIAANTNTGPATVSVNGLPAKTIRTHDNNDLPVGSIKSNQGCCLVYDLANDHFRYSSHDVFNHTQQINPHPQYITAGEIPSAVQSFFTDELSSEVGYLDAANSDPLTPESNILVTPTVDDVPVLVDSWIRDNGALVDSSLDNTESVWRLDIECDQLNAEAYVEIGLLRNGGGEDILGVSDNVILLNDRRNYTFRIDINGPFESFVGDKILYKIYFLRRSGGPNPDVTLYMEGTTNSRAITRIPTTAVPSGVTSLNTGSGITQNATTGDVVIDTNTSYLDTLYLGLTNQAADSLLLNGFSETSADTLNTIARRDSNADVRVRTVRSTFAETGTAPINTASVCFRVNDSTDNFMRFMTKGALQAWMDLGVLTFSGVNKVTTTATGAVVDGELECTTWLATSDQRLKTNIKDIPPRKAREIIKALQVVEFDFIHGKTSNVGFLAQQILDIFPPAVKMQENGFYAVDYNSLFSLALVALQDVDERLEKIEAELYGDSK